MPVTKSLDCGQFVKAIVDFNGIEIVGVERQHVLLRQTLWRRFGLSQFPQCGLWLASGPEPPYKKDEFPIRGNDEAEAKLERNRRKTIEFCTNISLSTPDSCFSSVHGYYLALTVTTRTESQLFSDDPKP